MKIRIGVSDSTLNQISGMLKFFKKEKYDLIDLRAIYKKDNLRNDELIELIDSLDFLISSTSLNIITHNLENDYYEHKQKTKNKKHPIYINIFHGTMVKTPMKFIKKKWATFDYFVTPDKYTTNIMKMVGWKKSELIKSPYPRLDFYLDYPNEKIEEFKTKYGFEKVVFYAPSWIGNKGFTENEIYISLNKILKDLKEDEKLIVSNHNIREVKILYKYDSKYVGKVFINKVDFELEHNAFFKVSNKMITDFSSIVYDFAKLYGWEKIDFYNPIDDEENSINVRKTYEKQYGEYGQIYLLKNKKVFIDEKKRRKKIGSGYQKPKNMSNSEYLFKKIEKIILKNTK